MLIGFPKVSTLRNSGLPTGATRFYSRSGYLSHHPSVGCAQGPGRSGLFGHRRIINLRPHESSWVVDDRIQGAAIPPKTANYLHARYFVISGPQGVASI